MAAGTHALDGITAVHIGNGPIMGAGRLMNSLNRRADNGFIALIDHLSTH